MSEIDDFASGLLEEAKRFLEMSKVCEVDEGVIAFRHAAILTGFCALEAHINSMADEFVQGGGLRVHEEGLLSERKVRLKDGQFVLSDSLEMTRLEDRILFLHRRFSGNPLDRDSSWWCELGASTKLRNQLTHPKSETVLSERDVERSLQAIIDTINAMFLAIYKRPLPVAARGLQSKMTF